MSYRDNTKSWLTNLDNRMTALEATPPKKKLSPGKFDWDSVPNVRSLPYALIPTIIVVAIFLTAAGIDLLLKGPNSSYQGLGIFAVLVAVVGSAVCACASYEDNKAKKAELRRRG